MENERLDSYHSSILQPMDLVVNSVVKSAMIRQRVELLMEYFINYKNRYLRQHCSLDFSLPSLILLPRPSLKESRACMQCVADPSSTTNFASLFNMSFKVLDSHPLCQTVIPKEHLSPTEMSMQMSSTTERSKHSVGRFWMWKCDLLRLNGKRTRSLF
jgi:hypothetical protein